MTNSTLPSELSAHTSENQPVLDHRNLMPLPNYTLSTVCPNCASPTYRRACKVRCDRCGFMWDCSEL